MKCREVEMNESCCKNSRVQAVVAGLRVPGDGSQQEMVQDIVYIATPQHCTSPATTAANTHHEEAACSVCTKLLMSHSRQKQELSRVENLPRPEAGPRHRLTLQTGV